MAFSLQQSQRFEFESGIQQVAVDNLQNTYVVAKDNSLSKINKAGEIIARANFKSYGDITHLDATNPFMLFLFYRNQNVLLVTDNYLNLRSTIRLDDLESDYIMALGRSVDDGIWIFDQNDYQLKKYDQNLELQQNSGNVMNWLSSEPDFNFLIAENNYVYLQSPSNGILVFDQFANYFKTIPIKNADHFQVINGQIYYQSDSVYVRYKPHFLLTDTLSTAKAGRTVIMQNKIRVSHSDKLLDLEIFD